MRDLNIWHPLKQLCLMNDLLLLFLLLPEIRKNQIPDK